jgi:cysteine sulfinate desulfinase/cysteine desulfurase-like protein
MNEALLYSLYRQNIEASIGGGQFQTLTTILKQCGHTDETSLGAISFALSEGTTEDDLRMALDAIVIAVRKLKKMSVAL